MTIPQSPSRKRFSWFAPEKAFPTEYELLTVGHQTTPEEWLHVDWPVRFDDGRAPFVKESTILQCADWKAFRDPAALMQRDHVAEAHLQGQALAGLLRELLQQGTLSRINPAWRDSVLGTYYAAWPFVEYGQFLALSYAVRETLAGTLTFGFAFQASDKLRHSQDIVHYLAALQQADPGFSDAAAREAWMQDPALVPLRENLERIINLRDWAEILVAANLVLEPLVGELFKSELLARHAALHGDPVLPFIMSGNGADSRRHRQFAERFVQFVAADATHGSANRQIVDRWFDKWIPQSEAAAKAFRPIFELSDLNVEPFDECYDRVRSRHQQLLADLKNE
jgi:methane monooxygenase component A beta chain/propane monooxygenase small subunit